MDRIVSIRYCTVDTDGRRQWKLFLDGIQVGDDANSMDIVSRVHGLLWASWGRDNYKFETDDFPYPFEDRVEEIETAIIEANCHVVKRRGSFALMTFLNTTK